MNDVTDTTLRLRESIAIERERAESVRKVSAWTDCIEVLVCYRKAMTNRIILEQQAKRGETIEDFGRRLTVAMQEEGDALLAINRIIETFVRGRLNA